MSGAYPRGTKGFIPIKLSWIVPRGDMKQVRQPVVKFIAPPPQKKNEILVTPLIDV